MRSMSIRSMEGLRSIYTRSLGPSAPLLLAPVEGTGALGALRAFWGPLAPFSLQSYIILEAVLRVCVCVSVGHKFYIQLALPTSPDIMDGGLFYKIF